MKLNCVLRIKETIYGFKIQSPVSIFSGEIKIGTVDWDFNFWAAAGMNAEMFEKA